MGTITARTTTYILKKHFKSAVHQNSCKSLRLKTPRFCSNLKQRPGNAIWRWKPFKPTHLEFGMGGASKLSDVIRWRDCIARCIFKRLLLYSGNDLLPTDNFIFHRSCIMENWAIGAYFLCAVTSTARHYTQPAALVSVVLCTNTLHWQSSPVLQRCRLHRIIDYEISEDHLETWRC